MRHVSASVVVLPTDAALSRNLGLAELRTLYGVVRFVPTRRDVSNASGPV